RDCDRDGALALYRALEFSPSCARRDHCGLGGQTWPKESGHGRFRLRTRPRFGNVFQTDFYPCRRRGPPSIAGAFAQSGFRTVSAARARHFPGRGFRLHSGGPSRDHDAAICGARLDKSGIRLFGAGDITDDDLLNNMGDVALGIETAYFYSAAHPSEKNKAFVEGVKRTNNGMRANFFGVSGYDGMHLIYEAIRKTGGKTNGDSFIGAVKGMSWESPRGPMTIDPETRDVISNIYMRRVERVNGELWNIEFATVENVKDPVKAAKK